MLSLQPKLPALRAVSRLYAESIKGVLSAFSRTTPFQCEGGKVWNRRIQAVAHSALCISS